MTKQGRVQRIEPSSKDSKQCEKREFDAKGLKLIKELRKELDQVKRGGKS